IDLDVVSELPLALSAMPERLAVALLADAMVFEQAPTFFRQRDRLLTRTGYPDRLNEPLLAQVPQVARPRIERSIMLVAKITTGYHSKRADGRERPRLRATQRVLTS